MKIIMTFNQAVFLIGQYEPILVGKPIGKNVPNFIIQELNIQQVNPSNYEVVLVAPVGDGIDSIHRYLGEYLEEYIEYRTI